MDSPTAWNVNDKSDYLKVNSDGLGVNYEFYGYIKNIFAKLNIGK